VNETVANAKTANKATAAVDSGYTPIVYRRLNACSTKKS